MSGGALTDALGVWTWPATVGVLEVVFALCVMRRHRHVDNSQIEQQEILDARLGAAVATDDDLRRRKKKLAVDITAFETGRRRFIADVEDLRRERVARELLAQVHDITDTGGKPTFTIDTAAGEQPHLRVVDAAERAMPTPPADDVTGTPTGEAS